MAELATGLLGAAATVGAASLTAVSDFARRHEVSLREEIQDTRRNTEDFMENLRSGDVTRLEEQEFLMTRQKAVQVETEYYESIENYKTASWLNPMKKVKRKVEVRNKKGSARRYNHSLRSLNESMHSGSDTSSTVASSGSPPGSNLAAEDIQEWASDVAGESEGFSDGDMEEVQPPDVERDSKTLNLSPDDTLERLAANVRTAATGSAFDREKQIFDQAWLTSKYAPDHHGHFLSLRQFRFSYYRACLKYGIERMNFDNLPELIRLCFPASLELQQLEFGNDISYYHGIRSLEPEEESHRQSRLVAPSAVGDRDHRNSHRPSSANSV